MMHVRRNTPNLSSLALLAMLTAAVAFAACDGEPASDYPEQWDEPVGSQDWLDGDPHEKFATLADQMEGFSRAMWQVGYRYNELYFAGLDENWDLARYHAQKISDAIEAGIERRPARGNSAQGFLTQTMPEMLETIEQADRAAFEQTFEQMRQSCNACHVMEDVEFIEMRTPQRRLYPWGSMQEYEDAGDDS